MKDFSGTFPAYDSAFLKTQQTSNTYIITFICIRGESHHIRKETRNGIITYSGVDASHRCIKHKKEERLIVCIANTVIYPYAMVVLYINRHI